MSWSYSIIVETIDSNRIWYIMDSNNNMERISTYQKGYGKITNNESYTINCLDDLFKLAEDNHPNIFVLQI